MPTTDKPKRPRGGVPGNKGGHGKPPALTKDTKATVLRWLSVGMPLDVAARLSGIHPATLRTWRQKSRDGKGGVYGGFEAEVRKAMAEGEAVHVARVAEAGRTNWRAAAWLLERMNPAQYALPDPDPDEEGSDGHAQTPGAPPDPLAGL